MVSSETSPRRLKCQLFFACIKTAWSSINDLLLGYLSRHCSRTIISIFLVWLFWKVGLYNYVKHLQVKECYWQISIEKNLQDAYLVLFTKSLKEVEWISKLFVSCTCFQGPWMLYKYVSDRALLTDLKHDNHIASGLRLFSMSKNIV